MPKRKPTSIATLPPLDLAYAVQRLVASGKATQAEVLRLAAERVQRIAALEAELKALTHGGAVAAPAAPAARVTAKASKKVSRKAAAAPKVAAKKAAKKPSSPKPHLSPKLRAFRKVQGLYAGFLRNFEGAARERIRQINASEGAASAVEEMKTLLREKAKAAAKTPSSSRKASMKPASAPKKPSWGKLKITPQRKAQLKTHGTYIGLLRGLPVAEKAKMKALAAKSGMAAAVEVMKRGGR